MKDLQEYVAVQQGFSRRRRIRLQPRPEHQPKLPTRGSSPSEYRGFSAPPERVKANVRTIFAELTKPS